MPRDLFGDVTRPSISIGNGKWYTVPVSLLSHSAIVAAVIAAPVLATPFLPEPWQKIGGVVIPVAAVPAPPPKPRLAHLKPVTNPNAAPTVAPETIAPEQPRDFETSFQENTPGVVGGVDDIDTVVAPPPPKPVEQGPVRVGGAIRQPQKVHDLLPTYPAIAQAARVQGLVIVEATISEDGRVVNARVLRSIPLLDEAALEAVRQWRYTPTLLNGVPVPVIMTVTVQFTLSR
jgi:protein TonB